MEEGIIILMILFLIFGTGGENILFFDIDEKDVSIEEDKIIGNKKIEEKEYGNNDVYKIFKDSITGNATLNLSTEGGDIYSFFEKSIAGNSQIDINSKKGNIYVWFQEKITGNITLDIKSYSGDIHILFDEKVIGNPNITIGSLKGNIIFYNERNTIQKYMMSIKADNIEYNKKVSKSIFSY